MKEIILIKLEEENFWVELEEGMGKKGGMGGE